MRALVKAKSEPGIWMEDRPVPEIGPEDVLVKVHKTGICGTDIHIYKWDEWARKTVPVPMITGHEYAGEIAAIGADVKNLTIGQRVEQPLRIRLGRHLVNRRDELQVGVGEQVGTPRRPAGTHGGCRCRAGAGAEYNKSVVHLR